MVGAHTVGAPDGGPGIPGTGWSVEHGDIRVAHFVGLHAFQALPIVALLLRRRVGDALTMTRTTVIAAASYAGLFGILLWQALRGQSIIRPDAITIELLAAWAAVTVVALILVVMRRPFRATNAVVHR